MIGFVIIAALVLIGLVFGERALSWTFVIILLLWAGRAMDRMQALDVRLDALEATCNAEGAE